MEYLMNHKKIILKYIIYISILIFFISCTKQQEQQVKKELPPVNVNVITVKKEFVPIWMRYTGMTKASSDQEVRARVAGILEK
jgi:hypothetical protein